MKTAQIFLSFLFALIALVLLTGPVNANQITSYTITPSDSRPGETNSHTHAFTHETSDTLFSMAFQYCTTPSGTCTKPANLVTQTQTAEGTIAGLDALEWSVNSSGDGTVYLENHGDGEDPGASQAISIGLTGIDNNTVTGGNCEPANNSAETCYVRFNSYSDIARTSEVDEGIGSYTIVAYVDVKARVDPLFTFTVSGDAADEVHNDITTSETSLFNELDFGNLTANTPKYIAHGLTVTTNTENGYTIEARMVTAMTGVYVANNIDPFAATGVSWAAPMAWTEPTGTSPSVDTGWIGANTDDADVSQFDAEEFGPIDSTNRTVMSESGSDNGTTTVYVTYGIEANVFQPADTYAGILIYTALPTY